MFLLTIQLFEDPQLTQYYEDIGIDLFSVVIFVDIADIKSYNNMCILHSFDYVDGIPNERKIWNNELLYTSLYEIFHSEWISDEKK